MNTINKVILAVLMSFVGGTGMVSAATDSERFEQWQKAYDRLDSVDLHRRIEVGKIFGPGFLVTVNQQQDEDSLTVTCSMRHMQEKTQEECTAYIRKFHKLCRNLCFNKEQPTCRYSQVTFQGQVAGQIAHRIEQAKNQGLINSQQAVKRAEDSEAPSFFGKQLLQDRDLVNVRKMEEGRAKCKTWSKWLANGTIAGAAGLVMFNKFRQK